VHRAHHVVALAVPFAEAGAGVVAAVLDGVVAKAHARDENVERRVLHANERGLVDELLGDTPDVLHRQ
jgi:hypothetical protein